MEQVNTYVLYLTGVRIESVRLKVAAGVPVGAYVAALENCHSMLQILLSGGTHLQLDESAQAAHHLRITIEGVIGKHKTFARSQSS